MMIGQKGISGLAVFLTVAIGLVSLPEAGADFVPLKCENNGGESVSVYPAGDGKTFFEVQGGAFCLDGQFYQKSAITILSIGLVGEIEKGGKKAERRVVIPVVGSGAEEVVTVEQRPGEFIQEGQVIGPDGEGSYYSSQFVSTPTGVQGVVKSFDSPEKPSWVTESRFRESTEVVVDSDVALIFTTIFENGGTRRKEVVKVLDGEGTVVESSVTTENL